MLQIERSLLVGVVVVRSLKPLTRTVQLLHAVLFVLLLGRVYSTTTNSHSSNSNPFYAGCLQQKRTDWKLQRVCNSDDEYYSDNSAAACRPPPLPYPEIRIYTQNWQSVFFESWLLQILLSELLDIPTSVETGYAAVLDQMNFYYPTPPEEGFVVAPTMTLEMIESGATYGDCSQANRLNHEQRMRNDNNNNITAAAYDNDNYQVCFHVVPEVWTADLVWIKDLVHRGIAEPPLQLGVLGQEALYVPKFTAQTHPSFTNYLALQDPNNRRKLAETFLHPTTWHDYCRQISPTNCTTPDAVAQRPPAQRNVTTIADDGGGGGENEMDRYFHPNDYTGYFRATDKNNCDDHPDNCTGHVADFPCGWSSYVVPYTHHLNIALEGDGPEPYSKGYTYNQLQDIWRAANATKSHVMMMYWSPEPLFQEFLGTDSEFVKVQFPYPTQTCVDHRISREDRCTADLETRVGSPLGACDEPATTLMKIISTSLYDVIQDSIDDDDSESTKSPGLDVLKSFQLTELQLDEIFQLWNGGQGMDPRSAVCTWAADNLDFLQSFVPRQYPRQIDNDNGNDALLYSSLILGIVVTIIVLGTSVWVYRRRKSRVVAMARVDFLFLLLSGSFLIAIGAIVVAAPAKNASCVAEIWLIGIGYALELVPLIVKVAAINKLVAESQRMRRVKLKKKHLFLPVFVILAIVTIFLTVWTALDPPRRYSEYELTDEVNEDGYTVVISRYYCKSNSSVWTIIAVGWNVLFLFCATVLAVQMGINPQEQVSEARMLAFLIYSHTGFVVLRVITYFLSSAVDEWTLARCRSLIFSIDTLATIV